MYPNSNLVYASALKNLYRDYLKAKVYTSLFGYMDPCGR